VEAEDEHHADDRLRGDPAREKDFEERSPSRKRGRRVDLDRGRRTRQREGDGEFIHIEHSISPRVATAAARACRPRQNAQNCVGGAPVPDE
jgi:hypothetical protein